MKEPLFFHVRPGIFNDLTYCISKEEESNTLIVGYAVTHDNDQFCKKTGRTISEVRMREMANRNKNPNLVYNNEARIHPAIQMSIDPIARRSAELLKMKTDEPIVIKTLGEYNNSRVPTMLIVSDFDGGDE